MPPTLDYISTFLGERGVGSPETPGFASTVCLFVCSWVTFVGCQEPPSLRLRSSRFILVTFWESTPLQGCSEDGKNLF